MTEDQITEEMHEEMETEGRLQTVCIREEREYLSLSSWMRKGGVKMEKRRNAGCEGGERCQRSTRQMDDEENCCLCCTFKVSLIQWCPVHKVIF